MNILVFEDSAKELKRAMRAVVKAGHHIQWIAACAYEDLTKKASYDWADGIITDLYFNPISQRSSYCDPEPEENEVLPPGGLLVVTYALSYSKPVVVCTDADYHCSESNWIVFSLGRYTERKNWPFGWCDEQERGPGGKKKGKDWNLAIKELERRIEQGVTQNER